MNCKLSHHAHTSGGIISIDFGKTRRKLVPTISFTRFRQFAGFGSSPSTPDKIALIALMFLIISSTLG
jgi:hypothetical protein